jgi:hypothetical protein
MRRLVIVSAGTSQPSTTRMLADRIAAGSLEVLREMEITATRGGRGRRSRSTSSARR